MKRSNQANSESQANVAAKTAKSNGSTTDTLTIETPEMRKQRIAELKRQLAEAEKEESLEQAASSHAPLSEQDQEETITQQGDGPLDAKLQLLLLKRQLLGTKLPNFDGNHRDWPAFIEKYESTTRDCRLANDENLSRLQDALSGRARNLVRNNLVHAKDVPLAIRTLKETYGHPRIIMDKALQDVMKMPNLRMDLQNLPDFATEAQRIFNSIDQSVGTKISEGILLQLEKRLPPTLVLHWAHEKARSDNGLDGFNAWLSETLTVIRGIGMDFEPSRDNNRSEVDKRPEHHRKRTNDWDQKPTKRLLLATAQTQGLRRERGKKGMKGHNTPSCVMNCIENHGLEECPSFLRLGKTERWQVLKRNKLCFACLGNHSRMDCRRINPMLE